MQNLSDKLAEMLEKTEKKSESVSYQPSQIEANIKNWHINLDMTKNIRNNTKVLFNLDRLGMSKLHHAKTDTIYERHMPIKSLETIPTKTHVFLYKHHKYTLTLIDSFWYIKVDGITRTEKFVLLPVALSFIKNWLSVILK